MSRNSIIAVVFAAIACGALLWLAGAPAAEPPRPSAGATFNIYDPR
jgi:hypothetical protein